MIREIQGLLKAGWYRLTSPPYRLLQKSVLFDPVFYREQNPDVAALGMAPLVHYLTRGFVEQRAPAAFFDRRYYLHQVPELDEKKENPLVHFLTLGRHQGLRPNPLVDPTYYASRTPGFASTGLDPLSHFLRTGRAGSHSPSPYFDPLFYCARYPDAAPCAQDAVAAYRHFFLHGIAEKRQPSAFFDTDWYLDKTPILHEQGLDPISHYHLFGVNEGKSPSPLFDPRFYRATCQADGEADPFAHYLRHEQDSNNRPCAWFDPVFYRKVYLAAGTAEDSPLKHYLQRGIHERAYPNRQVAELAVQPLISVVVPVYNVLPAYLNNCIRSVLYQSYPHWQLCLADDCSSDSRIRPLLARWAETDSRISVTSLPENRGISAATNAAAALAEGEYLAFLDNDDELAPEALYTFIRTMNDRGGDLFYCDEDLIGADGTRFSVFRKPAFNRELLLCHNYVTHCVVAAKSLFNRVGGCAGQMNGAQDHDLFLKLSEHTEKIVHIPEILYHWRASEASTSINHSRKEYANEAGRRSVAEALCRQGIPGMAEYTELKFFYRARRPLPNAGVCLLIHWRRPIALFRPWLSRLLDTAGVTVRQLAVGVESPEWLATVRETGREAGIAAESLALPAGTGTAAVYNSLLERIQESFVALVDCFVEDACQGWLGALLEYGGDARVGLVGGRINYHGDRDEAEVTPIPDLANISPAYYARFVANCSTLMNGLHCPQEVRSVTGDFCLVRRDVMREAGGFSAEAFPFVFYLQDLALRLHRQGRINMYTPYCASTLATSPSQAEQRTPALEKRNFQERWGDLLRQGDPYYNTGLLTDRQLDMSAFQAWLTGSSHPE